MKVIFFSINWRVLSRLNILLIEFFSYFQIKLVFMSSPFRDFIIRSERYILLFKFITFFLLLSKCEYTYLYNSPLIIVLYNFLFLCSLILLLLSKFNNILFHLLNAQLKIYLTCLFFYIKFLFSIRLTTLEMN